jgi:hypothetical protein
MQRDCKADMPPNAVEISRRGDKVLVGEAAVTHRAGPEASPATTSSKGARSSCSILLRKSGKQQAAVELTELH